MRGSAPPARAGKDLKPRTMIVIARAPPPVAPQHPLVIPTRTHAFSKGSPHRPGCEATHRPWTKKCLAKNAPLMSPVCSSPASGSPASAAAWRSQPVSIHQRHAWSAAPSLPAARSLQGSANKLALSPTSKGGCPETLQLSCSFKIQTSQRAGTWPGAVKETQDVRCGRPPAPAASAPGAAWGALPLAEQHLCRSRQTLKAASC